MADLKDLHVALDTLRQSGRTGKVYFYVSLEGDHKLQSGVIAVDAGARCAIAFQQLSAADAMARLPFLRYSKVTTLPAVSVEAGEPGTEVDMETLLAAVDPAQIRQAPPAVAPPPPPPEPVAQFEPVPAYVPPAPEPGAGPVDAPYDPHAKAQHVFYSHVAMQKDAAEVLEGLFGTAAQRKVEDIAHATPPLQHPIEFLNKCKQQAAMMLGPKKADELFQPLYDKVAQR